MCTFFVENNIRLIYMTEIDPSANAFVPTLAPILEDVLAHQTLIELVNKSLDNGLMKRFVEQHCPNSIVLSTDLVTVFRSMLSLSPNTLTDIEQAILAIIQDGVIDSKDVPQLIVLVQRLYQFVYSLKDVKMNAVKRAETTSLLLKYIIRLLVLERKIHVEEEKQPHFFAQMDALIGSCVGLLGYVKTLKPKCCFANLCR